jgi:hypothetical protein
VAGPRFIDVFIDPNPNCPEGCGQRFQTTGEPRPVDRVRYWAGVDDPIVCEISGWSSEGGGSPCQAQAVPVEDSGAGVVTLVYGGDWGLRLTPVDGDEPFGQPYLLTDPIDLLER